jgi:hypothetical protein
LGIAHDVIVRGALVRTIVVVNGIVMLVVTNEVDAGSVRISVEVTAG